jgi:hypothetical protein
MPRPKYLGPTYKELKEARPGVHPKSGEKGYYIGNSFVDTDSYHSMMMGYHAARGKTGKAKKTQSVGQALSK